jgi:hypothetical protein
MNFADALGSAGLDDPDSLPLVLEGASGIFGIEAGSTTMRIA